jgi:hypothetical protein
VTGLRWSAWSSTSARGTGTAHQNDCIPACYQGHFHSYRGLTVRLSKPVTCKGRREFSRLTYRFGASHPKGILLSGSQKFPCV